MYKWNIFVIYRIIKDKTMIYKMEHNYVLELDDVHDFIWWHLNGTYDSEEIAKRITKNFDLDINESTSILQNAINNLLEIGFIKELKVWSI